jgi:putative endonuclease
VSDRRAKGSQSVGIHGEVLAARHLATLGLTVVDRNVRLPGGEIDLVAREADELVFVEVKTRIGDDSTTPDLAVTATKLARLERLAEAYLTRTGDEDAPWRVDVVAIVIERSGKVLRLDHLRGAYL